MALNQYLSLITSQHRTKPKFMASVQAVIEPMVDCLDCLNYMNEKFIIDEASGDQLQIIADWVGASNAIPNSIPIPFFGFDGQPEALPMSETDDPDYGGYWRESGMSSFSADQMSEELFRKVVQAKILLNQSDCSFDSAAEIISKVVSIPFKFKDNKNMTVTFNFLDDYQDSDRELVKMMFPLPSGVKLIFGGEDEY